MLWKTVLFLVLVNKSSGWRSAFDEDLYESVLNEELCEEQLNLLSNNVLRNLFLDSSAKLPSGIASGNINDFGDYYQCLSIDANVPESQYPIQGKYCTVFAPLDQQDINWPPSWPPTWPETWPPFPTPDNTTETAESIRLHHWAQTLAGVSTSQKQREEKGRGRIFPIAITAQTGGVMAACVPKVCTAKQAIDSFLESYSFINATFQEYYCRLPNDRPFAPVDYIAIVIFSFIACLATVSTLYDLYNRFIVNKPTSGLTRCFSVYTNTRRFLSFNQVPDALECIDGIRAISMLWVVVGHTYSMTLLGFVHNIRESLAWLRLFTSTWVNSAPLTVDTFFTLSGILAVYTTVGKISRGRFIRTIHLFYINRLLRMFPLLATVILLQASVFNYVSDGPFWQNVAHATENCRQWWWSALLHVQNYVNPTEICLAHTWYLSVDTQLYFVCPLVIVWLFGSKIFAWAALCSILLLSLVSSSVYSFLYNFTAALVQPNRIFEFQDYLRIYYINTLTRAPPFFIGMAFGYLLHVYRGRRLRISKISAAILWLIALSLMSFCVFSIYPVMQLDHTAQTFDNFLNAYMRSLWAAGLGWVILACTHGYGGPVNWFLSLRMWKLPARLSYAMYLIHLPIIMIANSSWVKTHFFTNAENLYRFSSDIMLTFVAAFILCIFIDAPFSTLQKELLGNKKKKPPVFVNEEESQPEVHKSKL